MQRLDTRDQQVVIAQLRVAAHRTDYLMLARKATVPTNRNVHMLAVLFDMHHHLIDKATHDGLPIFGSRMRRIPKCRHVLGCGSDALGVRVAQARWRRYQEAVIFFAELTLLT